MSKYPNETAAMKILHLRNALIGEARDKIDQEVINNNDYNQAWKILENAYEDKRLIVDTHIDAILEIGKVTRENRDALSSHGFKVEGLAELILVNILYKKLDKETQEQWELELGRGELPVFSSFLDFLRERGRVLLRTSRLQQQTPQQLSTHPKQGQGFSRKVPMQNISKSFVQTVRATCPCCKSEHAIYQCPKFHNQEVVERKTVVVKSNLCFNCLKESHRVSDCPSDKRCKVQGCGRKHHSLLHFSKSSNTATAYHAELSSPHQQTSQEIQKAQESSVAVQSCANTLCVKTGTIKRQVLLSTAVVLVVGKGGTTIKSRALLDSGSDSHIVTERLAKQLNLKLEKIDLPISGLNDIQTKVKYSLSTEIQSRVNAFATCTLDFLVVPKVTTSLPIVEIDVHTLSLPSNIVLADPAFHTPGEIDLILGNEIFFDLIKSGRIKIEHSAVTLAETELGWVVGGAIHNGDSWLLRRVCQFNHMEDELNHTMLKFWEIETIPMQESLTETEAAVEEHFIKTHTRDKQGRYQVRLPFNELKDQLGDSYELAKKRFEKLKLVLNRNPDKRLQYTEFMSEYQSLGHMKEATITDKKGYFIPHHAVYKASSSTTKTRVVFDASAKTTSGISLNDALSVGPTVQSDLQSIILRFCIHAVVLTADIPKMYRQIQMYEEDCQYQRILWWNKKGSEQVFELQTVTYGVASSPYHATRALMQLARDEGSNYPLAAEVIKNDSYIDDFLTGSRSAESVIAIYQQLSALLAKGGFGVHKFCSNSPNVLKMIPANLHETQVSFNDTGINAQIKTLGLIWNPTEDYFGFNVLKLDSDSISSTKRMVLSDIGKLFDPLGFLGPVVTSAKLIMQEIWRLELEALPRPATQCKPNPKTAIDYM
ncbi:uncharacterized protein LOC128735132 [Sabethes cyaneus]|uniref:uncharacterized protein LOC128735132 n=1 Tax=Sabethes cyaneus TaxID=53552 RepID=UPI00237E63B4|nr:uncharacterized protein LOC128735132 [Sabethes cyaneus]